MAKPDHTSAAHDAVPAPTNPLSRPYWIRADAGPDEHDAATLAGLIFWRSEGADLSRAQVCLSA
jgi:hypothetical protein